MTITVPSKISESKVWAKIELDASVLPKYCVKLPKKFLKQFEIQPSHLFVEKTRKYSFQLVFSSNGISIYKANITQSIQTSIQVRISVTIIIVV